MVGTEQGRIVMCNRKGKNDGEKISSVYPGHWGPVYSVRRHPIFPKNFLSAGDWTVRIWSDEIRDECIICTKYWKRTVSLSILFESTPEIRRISFFLGRACSHWPMLSGRPFVRPCFSQRRLTVETFSFDVFDEIYEVLFENKLQGTLDIWDILFKQHEPTLSLRLSDQALHCLKVQEPQGRLVASGSNDGVITLIELSKNLCTIGKSEKNLMTSVIFIVRYGFVRR